MAKCAFAEAHRQGAFSCPPSDPERLLGRAFDLPNAVWRFQGVSATCTRCLMLAFRYTAVSDEKREGLVGLGFNLGTGAVVSDILARLQPALAAQMPDWQAHRPGDQAGCWPRMECSDARCPGPALSLFIAVRSFSP